MVRNLWDTLYVYIPTISHYVCSHTQSFERCFSNKVPSDQYEELDKTKLQPIFEEFRKAGGYPSTLSLLVNRMQKATEFVTSLE